jgi:hypothetical protein
MTVIRPKNNTNRKQYNKNAIKKGNPGLKKTKKQKKRTKRKAK